MTDVSEPTPPIKKPPETYKSYYTAGVLMFVSLALAYTAWWLVGCPPITSFIFSALLITVSHILFSSSIMLSQGVPLNVPRV